MKLSWRLGLSRLSPWRILVSKDNISYWYNHTLQFITPITVLIVLLGTLYIAVFVKPETITHTINQHQWVAATDCVKDPPGEYHLLVQEKNLRTGETAIRKAHFSHPQRVTVQNCFRGGRFLSRIDVSIPSHKLDWGKFKPPKPSSSAR